MVNVVKNSEWKEWISRRSFLKWTVASAAALLTWCISSKKDSSEVVKEVVENEKPSVSLELDRTNINKWETVTLQISTSDNDGNVEKITIIKDDKILKEIENTDGTEYFEMEDTPETDTTYYVEVEDNDGAVSYSKKVEVTVNIETPKPEFTPENIKGIKSFEDNDDELIMYVDPDAPEASFKFEITNDGYVEVKISWANPEIGTYENDDEISLNWYNGDEAYVKYFDSEDKLLKEKTITIDVAG